MREHKSLDFAGSSETKRRVDSFVRTLLGFFALLSGSFIVIIILILLFQGMKPFLSDNLGLGPVNFWTFLTSDVWLIGPTFASNLYGIGFAILSTLFIAFLSLLLSFPIGVLTALFIAKIAPKPLAKVLRTVIETLSSIPSIVYGLIGAGVILQFVYDLSALFQVQSKGGNSILAVVLVLTLMSIPTITSISEVAIRSVDQALEQGSLALGATKTQTNFKVVLASAKSGIFTAAILGIGRALGEATAVSLVAGGRRSGVSFDFLDITSTLTSLMLEGIKETTGLDYDIRFSVGLVLMVVILITNLTLNAIKKRMGNIHVKD